MRKKKKKVVSANTGTTKPVILSGLGSSSSTGGSTVVVPPVVVPPVLVPPVVVTPTIPTVEKWVQFPNGLKVYDFAGNVSDSPVQISLSGTDSNILTAIANFGDNGSYQLRYAIDNGDFTENGHNIGWCLGLPNGLVLPADGRVHSLTIGQIGNIWGTNPSTNKMHKLYQVFFKVGGSPALPSAIQYPNTFQPKSSLLPQFVEQFPDFYLPTKYNAYAGAKRRQDCNFDFRKRGFAFWELNNEGISTFPNTVNYQTHYDGTFKAHGWNDTNGINNATRAEVEALAVTYMQSDTPKDKGLFVDDGEWINGVPMTANGKLMFKYFFEKCKAESPNTKLAFHHARAYTFPSGYDSGDMSLSDIAKPFRQDYTKDQLINDYVNNQEFGQLWADIPGLARGDNAGAVLQMSVNAYVSMYNYPFKLYAIVQELFINKKFYPNSLVCATIMGTSEVSVSTQDGVWVAWNWQNGGESEILNPVLPASFMESVALWSNFIGDGLVCWGENEVVQETSPNVFYAFHSQVGRLEGNTDNTAVANLGKFAKQYFGVYDYAIAGLKKYYDILNYVSNVFIPDMSLDGGTTWLSGDDVTPVYAGHNKRPMCFAMQANGKTSILVQNPFNSPKTKQDFKVRVNGVIFNVSVNGQFPELFNF
jgi:hypothetical protein